MTCLFSHIIADALWIELLLIYDPSLFDNGLYRTI